MNKEEFTALVKEGTKEGVKEVLGEFNVDRETHYQHHNWLSGFFWFGRKAKLTAWVIFISAGVGGLLKLLWEFGAFILKTQGGV